MSLMALQDWKDSFASVPKVSDQTWKDNLGDWVYNNTSKYGSEEGMVLAGYTPPANIDFQFDKDTFAGSFPDSGAILDFNTVLATAWEAAILTSIWVITPPMTNPAFTAVASVTVEPPSLILGKAFLLSMVLVNVDDAKDSVIIPALRSAFLALTYTVAGTIGGSPATLTLQGVQ